MKYLKLFKSHTSYQNFINGSSVEFPNVSFCINESEMHYNHKNEVIFNLEQGYDGSDALVILFKEDSNIKSVKIDGRVVNFDSETETFTLDNVNYYGKLLSPGVYEISYQLVDNTRLTDFTNIPLDDLYNEYNDFTFYSPQSFVTNVKLPDTIEIFETSSLLYYYCNINTPKNLQEIESCAFNSGTWWNGLTGEQRTYFQTLGTNVDCSE